MTKTKTALACALLLAAQAAADVGQCAPGAGTAGCAAQEEEEEGAAMVQVRRDVEQAQVDAGEVKNKGAYDYTTFQLGDWPSLATGSLCAGTPSKKDALGEPLDHNEWQTPIDITRRVYERLPEHAAPRFKSQDRGCQQGYFHASPTSWQVDLQPVPGQQVDHVNCTHLSMEFNGVEYLLVQFHFHVVSEHTLDFQPYAGELHMVHLSASGGILVVGAFIEDCSFRGRWRRPDAFLEQVFETGFETDRVVDFKVPLNPYSVLRKGGLVWQYQGSLTTPPCTPGLQWLVAEKPVKLQTNYLNQFRAHLKAGRGDSYGHNRRPVQPLNGRKISQTHVAAFSSGKTSESICDLSSVHMQKAMDV